MSPFWCFSCFVCKLGYVTNGGAKLAYGIIQLLTNLKWSIGRRCGTHFLNASKCLVGSCSLASRWINSPHSVHWWLQVQRWTCRIHHILLCLVCSQSFWYWICGFFWVHSLLHRTMPVILNWVVRASKSKVHGIVQSETIVSKSWTPRWKTQFRNWDWKLKWRVYENE